MSNPNYHSDFSVNKIETLEEAKTAAKLIAREFICCSSTEVGLKTTYEEFYKTNGECAIKMALREHLGFYVLHNPTQKVVGAIFASSLFDENGKLKEYDLNGPLESDDVVFDVQQNMCRTLIEKNVLKPKEFKYLHFQFVAVDQDFKRIGLNQKMYDELILNAKKCGYQFVYCEFTGKASQKFGEKNGFNEVAKVLYRNIVHRGTNPWSEFCDSSPENFDESLQFVLKEI